MRNKENICPNCGGTLREGDRFCRSCGAKVVVEEQEIQPAQPEPRHCKNCGALLEEDAIFCIYCGTKNN